MSAVFVLEERITCACSNRESEKEREIKRERVERECEHMSMCVWECDGRGGRGGGIK